MDLGFGGSDLVNQVAGETEEERKKRLAQLQQARLTGPAAMPATNMLFGNRGLGTWFGGARMGIGQL
jgi:hypothetical protein